MEFFKPSPSKLGKLKRAGVGAGSVILAVSAMAGCKSTPDSGGGDTGGSGNMNASPVTSVPFSSGLPTEIKPEKPACHVDVDARSSLASISWKGPDDVPSTTPVQNVSFASYDGGSDKSPFIDSKTEDPGDKWAVSDVPGQKVTVTAIANLTDGGSVHCRSWTGKLND